MVPPLSVIPLQRIDGAPTTLAEFAGKVLLVVNVASKCGLTPQYEGLESLYRKHAADGLVVLGFPANDFKGQEPGSNEEVAAFCSSTYGVDFPMFAKVSVRGDDKHPLYRSLTSARPVPTFRTDSAASKRHAALPQEQQAEVTWNFEKFLVSRSGEVVDRFAPEFDPQSPEVVAAVERELLKS